MANVEKLQFEVNLARRELKNIRQELMKQKADLVAEVSKIKEFLSKSCSENNTIKCYEKKDNMMYSMTPIGFIQSCFNSKNGIPRQPSLCPAAKATLTIEKSLFTNPEHSLMGLEEFSHIWVLFLFHKNGTHDTLKAKVHPPRLNGASTGVFSTRSPHRPSPLGLSLIKLDKIEGNILFLSGIDLLDGTPVLDIKPYIPLYDIPHLSETTLDLSKEEKMFGNYTHNKTDEHSTIYADEYQGKSDIPENAFLDISSETNTCSHSELRDDEMECKVPPYLRKISDFLDVLFTNRASKELQNFHAPNSHNGHCSNCFNFLNSHLAAKEAIIGVLRNDPRSVYRRKRCSDRLHYFHIDNLHVTCWYDENIVEVLKIKPAQNDKHAIKNLALNVDNKVI